MLPVTSLKTIRDTQRQRSLGLSAQARLHNTSGGGSARSLSGTGSGGPLRLNSRALASTTRQRASHNLSTPNSAAWREAVEEEIAMAREDDEERAERGGGASDSDGSAGDGPGSERSTYLVQGGVSAVEVPLVDLVKPRPRRASSGFEIVRGVKAVIALDDDEFGRTSIMELGQADVEPTSTAEEGDEDEWELLSMDGSVVSAHEPKPKMKSWANVVRS